MFCSYQDREEIEDDLYREDDGDSEGSEVSSEVEFRLYSQLHYSSNALEDEEEKEHEEKSQDIQLLEVIANDNAEIGQSPESRTLSRKTREQQQPPKAGTRHKTAKGDKPNRKGDSKGKRSSSSLFEEVIVIDSGPDVITLSEDDTAEDDEGVCALKGRRHCTSTPAQKKGSLDEPVSVGSSSSESDSEESGSKSASASSDSSDSSDSDDLENWMILGRETQEGDHSISLNLEGEAESNTDVEEDFEDSRWSVSEKDREAQIYNKDKGTRLAVQRMTSRYYTSKNVHCRNCNKTGHLSKNCPEPKKVSPCFLCGTPGHQSSYCPYKHCNNCGLPGHLYASCNEKAYWHKICHRCHMKGHFFDACPEIWRQYHITIKTGPPVMQLGEDKGRTPAYCYNCAKRGHFGHDCTRQRMFNGTYPSTPFINHYDTTDDMNRRQQRMKMKVKELKKNGIFSAASESPSTPGPPKKKQKISHDKSYRSYNHTTSGANHPTPSHIFFSHTSSPKTYNKNKQQNCTSSEKPWKPKRPVPTSRDPLPTHKLIVDETSDFPRGGGNGGDTESRKKRKRKRTKKNGKPDHLFSTGSADGQRFPNEQLKKDKGETHRKGKKRAWRTADKLNPQMHPTDENLFIIKQRKRKR